MCMNYQAFKDELCRRLQKKAGGKRTVVLEQVEKNNGVMLDAVLIKGKEEKIFPTIYLEEFYEAYEQGADLEGIAEHIFCEEEKRKQGIDFSLEQFENYEIARTRVYYKLINYKMNERMLKRIPYVKYLDLAVVFYYRMESGCFRGGSILIQNNNLDTWGITKNQLLEDAAVNTSRKLPYSFQGMESLIAELTGQEEIQNSQEEEFMYVLTNEEKYFGAAALLYPHVLAHIGSVLKKNFFVLPSSVHECILVPDLGHYTRLELMKMVREVNQNQVEEEEILSYEIYYYDRKRETLVM